MTTALYLRQSLDRDHDELAIDGQREGLEALCAAPGWTDTKVYSDNDHSASVRMPGSTGGCAALVVAPSTAEVLVCRRVMALGATIATLTAVLPCQYTAKRSARRSNHSYDDTNIFLGRLSRL
jgi:DNA invertase Pin-like site-specific DNA recombinase